MSGALMQIRRVRASNGSGWANRRWELGSRSGSDWQTAAILFEARRHQRALRGRIGRGDLAGLAAASAHDICHKRSCSPDLFTRGTGQWKDSIIRATR